VRRKEKLTLWPNCLPFPVNSQRADILFFPVIFKIYISIMPFILPVKVKDI
jgi:hypothetical protein